MDREAVEKLIIEQGYTVVGKPSPSSNGSIYQKYRKQFPPGVVSDPKGIINIWLGSAYLESELWGHALPYKDNDRNQVLGFLEGKDPGYT